MPQNVNRRTLLGSGVGVLALAACGVKPVSTKKSNELLPYIQAKQSLVAALRTIKEPEAKTISEHQLTHINALLGFIELPSATPTLAANDAIALINQLIDLSAKISQTTSDDEVRRLVMLMGASDAVHRELLKRAS